MLRSKGSVDDSSLFGRLKRNGEEGAVGKPQPCVSVSRTRREHEIRNYSTRDEWAETAYR